MLWWCLWTISSNHDFPLHVKLPLLIVVSFSLSLTSQNPGEFLSFDYFIIITNQRRLTRQASQWPVSHFWGHYRVCKCTKRPREIPLYQTPHFLEKRKPDWQLRKVDIKCKSELPPANEVWGKVMFLHLCVMLFTGEGSLWWYLASLVFGKNCRKIGVNTSGPESIKWWHLWCHHSMLHFVFICSNQKAVFVGGGGLPNIINIYYNPLVTSSLFAF